LQLRVGFATVVFAICWGEFWRLMPRIGSAGPSWSTHLSLKRFFAQHTGDPLPEGYTVPSDTGSFFEEVHPGFLRFGFLEGFISGRKQGTCLLSHDGLDPFLCGPLLPNRREV